MKRIHVVAGVIYSACREQVLLARRKPNQHQGGLWEFPGGKLEARELPAAALRRELEEEVGILVMASSALMQIPWEYADKHILLDVHEVSAFSGEPAGLEGQEVRWVGVSALQDYAFPEANLAIVEKLQAG
ncbi:8-oxo-dGTP diphosphatase MutT [Granulosicoccaceae sp. 1_MG-2023]|nr:8-oxo-dGTP diphosphatase MutT [Granulosicoccaceae sp. 1_MG-2023]